MADPDSLVKGNCYFMVSYLDSELLIPEINTFIFIEHVDEDDEYWLFQDAESFAHKSTDPDYLAIPEDQLYSILDISELRNNLKGLLHLHPIKGNSTNKEVLLTENNKAIISKEVDRIFKEETPKDSLTITTNYRDKGVSIKYDDGNIVITMFTEYKESPEEEEQIRIIFGELDISPITDYLSQHDRVRVLSYSVEKPSKEIANIIGDIFLRAYKISDNEKINPHYRL